MKKDIQQEYSHMSKNYDQTIKKIVPRYNTIIKTIVKLLPFQKNQALDILDIGCGTGTLAYLIKKKFFYANITCLDPTPEMLSLAKNKLADMPGITYVENLVQKFSFKKKYDAICVSMVFQNLKNNKEKETTYKKIFKALKPDGIFIIFGPVKSTQEYIEEISMKNWSTFLRKSDTQKSCETNWMATYQQKDTPDTVISELNLLQKNGFQNIDLIEKKDNFALFAAFKS